ncbi:MAG: phage portal protein [Chloroflexi bacterium]|nr:phage portal protein [Chloroflexota bacterium]
MPSATQYTPDSRYVRAAADRELRDRQQAHQTAWRYYAGDHRKHLKPSGSHDDNVILNLCRQVVDRTVAFLVPDFPSLELHESADTDREKWLRGVWQANQNAVLLASMAINGALDGHVFARVVPDKPFPRIVNLNGANVIAFWDADDYHNVLWYELRWTVGRKTYRQDVVRDGGRWLIRDYLLHGSRWELQDEVIWPHALGPIIDWQHGLHPVEFYGRNELSHAHLNDLINKVASDTARILRFHAYPRTIGTGFEAANVQPSGIDDFWVIPDKSAQVFNLEMQSDLSSSLRFLQLLADSFLAESRVTMLNGDPQHFKGVTNLGVRVAYMDQIAKTEMLRRQYTAAIQHISQRLLMLGGHEFDVMVNVHWGEPLPVDRREAVELTAKQLELGLLDTETAAHQLGLRKVEIKSAV